MSSVTLKSTWLTLVTALTLLVSSVVSSAPLMTFQMIEANTKMTMSSHDDNNDELMHSSGHNDSSHHAMNQSMDPNQTHHALTRAPSNSPHHNSTSVENEIGSNNIDSMINCADGNNMSHNCCDATCTNVMAALSQARASHFQHTQLALMPLEGLTAETFEPSSLYRPPIA
ncbi:hypothetical protein DZ860_07450 [Vibrio sinensis]|uniref:Uncharacterized protein n=1 Tax=Vibrio sinensis TaxID=2302434 RepID=A0A3A6QNX8_9VIBR|nr:hypothetical protein [Vibrio sinensis]RJX72978.1 hypothetical protein DZ860_07450 [Vibrio sinensis]